MFSKLSNSSGRTFIEILGVLAIMAVLSIVAALGIPHLFNMHKSNETWHDVLLRAYYVLTNDDNQEFNAKSTGPIDGELSVAKIYPTSTMG